MPQRKNRELTTIVTALIVAAFAAGNFYWPMLIAALNRTVEPTLGPAGKFFYILTPLVCRNSQALWFAALGFGTLSAEAMLIAVCTVFARVNVVVRLACWLLVTLWMWYLLCLSPGTVRQTFEDPRMHAQSVVLTGALLGYVAALLLASLWFVKQAIGLRMFAPAEAPAAPHRSGFSFS